MKYGTDLLKSLMLHIALLAAFIIFSLQPSKHNQDLQIVKISMCNFVPPAFSTPSVASEPVSSENEQDHKSSDQQQAAIDTTKPNPFHKQSNPSLQQTHKLKKTEAIKHDNLTTKTEKKTTKLPNQLNSDEESIQQTTTEQNDISPTISNENANKLKDNLDDSKPYQAESASELTSSETNAHEKGTSLANINAKPTEQKNEERILVVGAEGGPSFLNQVKPAYPLLARRLGKTGTVSLLLSIDENGVLTAAEVISEEGSGFKEAAIEAVKKSSFRPAINAGKNIASKARLSIVFKLEN